MQLWSHEHAYTLLPAVVLMLLIAVGLRFAIGKKQMKVRMIPFQVLSVLLVIIEIGKQIVSYSGGYDLYHLPFHFCSLFIFSLPIMSFYQGRYVNIVRGVTAALCASMTLLLLIYPCLIYSAWDIQHYFNDYLAFHTVTFHNIVVFEFILIVALGLHTPEPKGEPKAAAVCTLIFSVVAASMSHLLKTNYANFYSCNVPPLEQLRLSVQAAIGVVPTALLYASIVTALQILFVLMCYWLYRLLRGTFVREKVTA